MVLDKAVLAICSECKKIRIDNENDIWLAEQGNERLYGRYMEKYSEILSHTYCHDCYDEALKELEE